jgi:hypothetical protein
VTKALAVPSPSRPSGTDDLTYGQLAAARTATRHLLDSQVPEPAEYDTLTQVVQRVSAVIDARPADLDGPRQRRPSCRFSREGEELPGGSGDVLRTLQGGSPEAPEAGVGREEQARASVRAFRRQLALAAPAMTERASQVRGAQ